jgi:hypothetical protein
MTTTPASPFWTRQRLLLVGGLVLALLVTVFFGGRLLGRLLFRPSREPIREWMSIPYVARSYGLPPPVLYEALGLPPRQGADHKPIRELASDLNLTVAEVIATLEARIAEGPPAPPDGREPPPP